MEGALAFRGLLRLTACASQVHCSKQPRTSLLVNSNVSRGSGKAKYEPTTTVHLEDLCLKAHALRLATHHEVGGLAEADSNGAKRPNHLLHDLSWRSSRAAGNLKSASGYRPTFAPSRWRDARRSVP